MIEPIPFAPAPNAAKAKTKAANQAASTGRCNRHARPNGPRSRPEAVARPGRSGSNPALWSRQAASRNAAATKTADAASGRMSTHHLSPAEPNARVSSTQPSGETQDSRDRPAEPESPTARSTKAAPSAAIAMPRTLRAVTASCAATAATPPKTSPHPLMDSASAAEPAAGSLSPDSQRNVSRAIATFAVAAARSAAVSGACRPTAAEPTSSSRPPHGPPRGQEGADRRAVQSAQEESQCRIRTGLGGYREAAGGGRVQHREIAGGDGQQRSDA